MQLRLWNRQTVAHSQVFVYVCERDLCMWERDRAEIRKRVVRVGVCVRESARESNRSTPVVHTSVSICTSHVEYVYVYESCFIRTSHVACAWVSLHMYAWYRHICGADMKGVYMYDSVHEPYPRQERKACIDWEHLKVDARIPCQERKYLRVLKTIHALRSRRGGGFCAFKNWYPTW